MDRNIIFFAAGIVLLFILIGAASFSNSSQYYLEPTDDGVQIWKGQFSPLGREMLMELEGVAAPEPVQPVYTREAALTLAFDHFMSQADRQLATPTEIDFDEIRELLDRTASVAVTDAQKIAVAERRTDVDLMVYLYKANAGASRGTRSGMEQAIELLEEASLLDLSPEQTTFVERQIELLNDLKANAPAEAPKTEAPEEKLEAAPSDSEHEAAEGHSGTEEAMPAEPEGHGAAVNL